jgi:hypothetical protein
MDVYIVGSIFLLIVALLGFLLYRYIHSLERTVHKVIEDFQEVQNNLQERSNRSYRQHTVANEGGAVLENTEMTNVNKNNFSNIVMETVDHEDEDEDENELNQDVICDTNDENVKDEDDQDFDNEDNTIDLNDNNDNNDNDDNDEINKDESQENNAIDFFTLTRNNSEEEDDGLDDMQDFNLEDVNDVNNDDDDNDNEDDVASDVLNTNEYRNKIMSMKVGELRDLAKELNLQNTTNMRKNELRDLILELNH